MESKVPLGVGMKSKVPLGVGMKSKVPLGDKIGRRLWPHNSAELTVTSPLKWVMSARLIHVLRCKSNRGFFSSILILIITYIISHFFVLFVIKIFFVMCVYSLSFITRYHGRGYSLYVIFMRVINILCLLGVTCCICWVFSFRKFNCSRIYRTCGSTKRCRLMQW